MKKKKYFGTDGIRGRVKEFPIVEDFFFKLAVSIKKTKKNTKKILIGRDTRVSGKCIERALRNGFKEVKVDCDFIGVASTPMVSFYTKFFNYDFGIMISASHNPYNDNGIKIFKSNGEKLSDEEELKIETNYDRLKIISKFSKAKISYKKIDLKDYKNFLKKNFKDIDLSGIKVLIDCANGSVYKLAPSFFKEIGCKVVCYSNKPDGKNINKNCGATFPERLCKLTKKHKVDVGLSFDGDADRVVISDENGNLIDGDKILAIICKYKRQNSLPVSSIVSTKMSNLAFRDFIKKLKVKLILSKVGDRYVIQKMKENHSNLGGEPSGHIIFPDNGYCGDGILTSIYIMNILRNTKIKLSDFSKSLYEKNYQNLVNLKTLNNPDIIMQKIDIKKIKKKLLPLNKDVDFLVRKSGTENLIRIMVQSYQKKNVDKTIEKIVNIIKKVDE